MKKNNPGFTILELIMVVIITGVLAAMAVPQYSLFVEKSRAAEAISYIGAIKKAQISFIAGNVSGYGAPNIDTLGLSNSTSLWEYNTSYISVAGGIIHIVASRNSGEYNGSLIYMDYYMQNSGHYWGGNHPGTPKS